MGIIKTPQLLNKIYQKGTTEQQKRDMTDNNKGTDNQRGKKPVKNLYEKMMNGTTYGEGVDLAWLEDDNKFMPTFILDGEEDPYQGKYDEHPTIEAQFKQLKMMPKINDSDTQDKRHLFWDMYDIEVGGRIQSRLIEIDGDQAQECIMNWEAAYTNFIEWDHAKSMRLIKEGGTNTATKVKDGVGVDTFIIGSENDPYKGNYENHPDIEDQHDQLYFMEKVNLMDTQQRRKEFWELYLPNEIDEKLMTRDIEKDGDYKTEVIVDWKKAYTKHIGKLQEETKEKVSKKQEEWKHKRKEIDPTRNERREKKTWYELCRDDEEDSTSTSDEEKTEKDTTHNNEYRDNNKDKEETKTNNKKETKEKSDGKINQNYNIDEKINKSKSDKNTTIQQEEKKHNKKDKGKDEQTNVLQLPTGQRQYTTEQACDGVENAPRHRQVIEIGLKAVGQDLSETGWIKLFREFYALMKEGDANAMIVRRRQESKRNTITRIEEIPLTQKELEQDYVFDVNIVEEGSRLRLRMITATTVNFQRLFKSKTANNVYKKLIEREWYVKTTSLTTQGPRQTMGWLKGLHPVWTNRDNLLMEIKALLVDISPHIEVYPRNETRYYKDQEDEDTVQKIEGRYIVVSAPKDISNQMTAIMGQRLRQLKEENQATNKTTIINSQFIPYSRKISAHSQIIHLKEHIEECQRYNGPIQIYNCKSLDKEFPYPDQLAQYAGQKNSKVGKPTTIRKILLRLKYVNNESNKKHTMVHSIEQMDEQRYAVLISNDIVSQEEARKIIFEIMTILRREVDGWPVVCGMRGGLKIDGEDEIDGNNNEQYIEELMIEDKKLIPVTSREYHNKYAERGQHSTRGRGRGRGNTRSDRRWNTKTTESRHSEDSEGGNNENTNTKTTATSYATAVTNNTSKLESHQNNAIVSTNHDNPGGAMTITNDKGEIELPGTIERYLDNKISMAVNNAIHRVNEDNRKQNMEMMKKVEEAENKAEETTQKMEEVRIAQDKTNERLINNDKNMQETKQAIESIEGVVQNIQESNNQMNQWIENGKIEQHKNINEIQNQVREESEATRTMIREFMAMMGRKNDTQHQSHTIESETSLPPTIDHIQDMQQKQEIHKQLNGQANDESREKATAATVTTTQETISTITKQDEESESEDEYNMKILASDELIECLDNTPQRHKQTCNITPQRTPSKRSKDDRSSDDDSQDEMVTTPKIQRITGPLKGDDKLEIRNNINITHIIKSNDNKGKIQNTNNTKNNNHPDTRGKKANRANNSASPYNTRASKLPARAGKPKTGEKTTKEPHHTPKYNKGGSRWGEYP